MWNLGPLTRGRWLTFVFHVRWSPNRNDGFVEVWRNGKKVLPLKRIPTIFAGHNVYVKQGLYRGHANWTSTIYHDGMRRYNARPRSLR